MTAYISGAPLSLPVYHVASFEFFGSRFQASFAVCPHPLSPSASEGCCVLVSFHLPLRSSCSPAMILFAHPSLLSALNHPLCNSLAALSHLCVKFSRIRLNDQPSWAWNRRRASLRPFLNISPSVRALPGDGIQSRGSLFKTPPAAGGTVACSGLSGRLVLGETPV